MRWWVVPLAIAAGKLVYDAVADDAPPKPDAAHATLATNFARLDEELRTTRARKIALVGQPGAGKSTFLKKVSQGRALPPPVIGQQTDATDWSRDAAVPLISRWDGYAVADVPGYDTAAHPVAPYLRSFPFSRFDAVLLFARTKLHAADQAVFARALQANRPVFVVRSFCEDLEPRDEDAVATDFMEKLPGLTRPSLIFLSSRTGRGLLQAARVVAGGRDG